MHWREDANRIGALPQRGGLKDYAPDGSWLQAQKLTNFYDERREILSEERVQKQGCLAVGQWIKNTGKVLVTKNMGKFWKNFGHTDDGKQWLYPEEALFLMDEGALEVLCGGIALSIQRAYAVLLGSSIPVHYYHVFAHLCRFGYVVRRHTKDFTSTQSDRPTGLDEPRGSDNFRKRKLSSLDIAEDGSAREIEAGDGIRHPKKLLKTGTHKLNVIDAASDISVMVSSDYRGWFNPRWFDDCGVKDDRHVKKIDTGTLRCDVGSLVLQAEFSSLADEISSFCLVAENWASLKRQLKDTRDEDWLLSSPVSVLWAGDVKPLVHPSQATSYESVLKKLQIIENFDSAKWCTSDFAQHDEALQIIYDVYQPDSKFRKSAPGKPSVCLCIARHDEATPGLADVMRLTRDCGENTTLMWSVVDSGDVSFYSFNHVNLPADSDLA